MDGDQETAEFEKEACSMKTAELLSSVNVKYWFADGRGFELINSWTAQPEKERRLRNCRSPNQETSQVESW